MKQLHKHCFTACSAECLRASMLLILLLSVASSATAQVTRYLNQGNTLYGQKRYKEAAADYAKAVAKNPTYTPGLFNLGNSLYQQKQFDSSRKVMEATEKVAKDKGSKAAANYNIGNTYMSQQKWEDAIDAYKKTLRANPQDADAKYNLSYAEQMLKKQQQENKDKKDKENKDKKDDQNKDQKKDQDKKDDQNKDNKDNQEKDNKDQKDQEKQQPQSQPSKLSQKQAEQLLNALKEEEKKLQDKMKKEKGVPVKMSKDW